MNYIYKKALHITPGTLLDNGDIVIKCDGTDEYGSLSRRTTYFMFTTLNTKGRLIEEYCNAETVLKCIL